MNNQAAFCVNGYVATPPSADFTRNGTPTLRMRIGWTPRRIDKKTGDWTDDETSFATVRCYSTIARNAAACLHKGDPILLKGTIKIREYVNQAGVRGHVVEITADSIGHDLSRGVSLFTKVPANLGQTALDRLREDVAAGRIRLPGDRVDAESAQTEADGDEESADDEGAEDAEDAEDAELFDDEASKVLTAVP